MQSPSSIPANVGRYTIDLTRVTHVEWFDAVVYDGPDDRGAIVYLDAQFSINLTTDEAILLADQINAAAPAAASLRAAKRRRGKG